MTARERVLSAINHKEPDKIPVDLGGTPSSGRSAIADNRLVKHTGIENKANKVYDVVQQVTQPEEEVLDLFHVDVVDVGRSFHTGAADWHDATLADGSIAQYPSWFHPVMQADGSQIAYGNNGEAIAKMPAGATFFDQLVFPYADGYPDDFKEIRSAMDRVLWQKFVHSPWDDTSADFWEKLRARALDLRSKTDRAITIVCGCNLFEWGTFLRRIDNFLMDLVLEPEKVEALLETLLEIHLQTLEKVCDAVGDVVDVLRFGDDLGTDTGMFMNPDIYRTLFKPRHQKLCDYVHKHSRMKTFLHSCGSIYPVIPDLIEAGYDIINPVQISARDMEPEKLKREFGRDITFWGGGCDTRAVLNRGTVQEVVDHVKRNIEILAPGGGWVFNTVHNIMPDVPPENIVAMFETVNGYR